MSRLDSNDLSDGGKDASGIVAFAEWMKQTRSLNNIRLSDVGLTAATCKALFSAMIGGDYIETMHLSDNDLTDGGKDVSGIVQIAEWMKQTRSLRKLELMASGLHTERNALGLNPAEAALEEGIMGCKDLVTLILRDNDLDPGEIQRLEQAIERHAVRRDLHKPNAGLRQQRGLPPELVTINLKADNPGHKGRRVT